MAEAKKRERAEALKKVKEPCKEFGFTAGMLKTNDKYRQVPDLKLYGGAGWLRKREFGR